MVEKSAETTQTPVEFDAHPKGRPNPSGGVIYSDAEYRQLQEIQRKLRAKIDADPKGRPYPSSWFISSEGEYQRLLEVQRMCDANPKNIPPEREDTRLEKVVLGFLDWAESAADWWDARCNKK